MDKTDSVLLDENIMKLLNYFITVKGYNPVILHGAQDEIWLENMDSDYRIVRIVSNYIHNDEQFKFDLFKTRQIVKKIKKQTLSFNINTLSIFVNLGDNVNLKNFDNTKNILSVSLKDIDDLNKYEVFKDSFSDIFDNLDFEENGMDLFLKLTHDINKKNEDECSRNAEIFKSKIPYVTVSLIVINLLLFLLMFGVNNCMIDGNILIEFGGLFKPLVLNGEYFRIFSSMFLHASILHVLINMYSLYIIGSQLESVLGKLKFFIIYIISGLCGSLMSLIFDNGICVGASSAIFGLLGSMLYFGYYYRVFLGNVLRRQIIPLIILNLGLGLLFNGVSSASHIGGFIGGLFATMLVGLKYKSGKSERINGLITLIIYISFLCYMVFFR